MFLGLISKNLKIVTRFCAVWLKPRRPITSLTGILPPITEDYNKQKPIQQNLFKALSPNLYYILALYRSYGCYFDEQE
jgi:hypothetical protein